MKIRTDGRTGVPMACSRVKAGKVQRPPFIETIGGGIGYAILRIMRIS